MTLVLEDEEGIVSYLGKTGRIFKGDRVALTVAVRTCGGLRKHDAHVWGFGEFYCRGKRQDAPAPALTQPDPTSRLKA